MLDGKVRDFFPSRPRTAPTFLDRLRFCCCRLFLFCRSFFFVCFRTLWDVINAVSQRSFPFYNFPYKYHGIIIIFERESFFTHAHTPARIRTRTRTRHTHTHAYLRAHTPTAPRRTHNAHAIRTPKRAQSNKRRQKISVTIYLIIYTL